VGYRFESRLIEGLPAFAEAFDRVEPIYETLPGWREDISQARKPQDLPKGALEYIKFLEQALGKRISLVSVGPAREQMIAME
jgi:adenylosuccinate synthase